MTDIPENVQVARQMYLDGATTAEIYFKTKLTKPQLYFWLDGGQIVDGKPLLEPIDRRQVRPRKVTSRERANMAVRMIRICDKQITEIENRKNATPRERDQDSRRIAMVMRTLDGLTTLDERNREIIRRKKAKPRNERARNGDEPAPRDIDELRRSVTRKLQDIIAEREGNAGGEM